MVTRPCLVPADHQLPAIHHHRGAAPGQLAPVGVHQRGAGPRTTGQGQAGTALPHPEQNTRRALDLGKADIGPLGKQFVLLQHRAQALDRQVRQIIDEEGGMRIAHRAGSRVRHRAHRQVQMQRVHRAGKRDPFPVQPRRAHIHLDQARPDDFRRQQTRDGAHRDLPLAALLGHQRRDAARGVAAGPGFGAVGIENAHEHIGLRLRIALQHDQLVAADAEAAVGDAAHHVRRERKDVFHARPAPRNRCRHHAFSQRGWTCRFSSARPGGWEAQAEGAFL